MGAVFLGVPDGVDIDEDGSSAIGISADGSTIVGFAGDFTKEEAAIWTQEAGWRLVEVILTERGVDLTGWQLKTAVAASANGRVIVGEGINPNGNTEAWLAVIAVPEPATVVLACVLVLRFAVDRGSEQAPGRLDSGNMCEFKAF